MKKIGIGMLQYLLVRMVPKSRKHLTRLKSTSISQCDRKTTIIELNKLKYRKHGLRNPDAKKPFQWHSIFLLPLPIVTFALGVWQLKRMKWKRELIESLKTQGRTDVQLRDEHLNYAITWFSFSVATTVMWIMRYLL